MTSYLPATEAKTECTRLAFSDQGILSNPKSTVRSVLLMVLLKGQVAL